MIAGQLEASVGVPILIGIVMAILVVLICSFVRWVVRSFEKRRLSKIVRETTASAAGGSTMTPSGSRCWSTSFWSADGNAVTRWAKTWMHSAPGGER